jgi:hypothetical protein
VRVLAALLLLLTLASPAWAQHAQGGRAAQGPGRPTPPQQAPARDMRQPQRDVRMTPEQRRQLRQDVADHGRDIYGRPPPNKQ